MRQKGILLQNNFDIAVCILFFEKVEQTIECIQSFLPSRTPVYILNNGSSEKSRQILENFTKNYPNITIFDSQKNLGVSCGRNYLISHVPNTWLFFVDNDIIINTRDWIQKMQKHFAQNPEVDVFIPSLYNKHEKIFNDYSRSLKINGGEVRFELGEKTKRINWFPGGASIVNREIFDRLGLYDEDMFVGGEDFELCIRAIKMQRNLVAYCIGDIELVHDHRTVNNECDKNATAIRYDRLHQEKSFQRITEKHNVILNTSWIQWSERQRKIISGKSQFFTLSSFKEIVAGIIPAPIKKIISNLLCLRVKPISCSLFMTYSCNFNCEFCRRNVSLIPTCKNMELSVVQQLLNIYPDIQYFTLAGFGEPTLCPDFHKIVDFLKENHTYVGIITNGSNIEPFLRLKSIPNSISISLYGYDSSSYLKTTGRNGFDKVIANFKELKAKFKNVGFSFVITKTNYHDLEKILILCDQLKPDYLDLHNCLGYKPEECNSPTNTITKSDTEIIKIIDEKIRGRSFIRQKPVYIDLNRPGFSCKSHNFLINMDGEGNIGGCQRQIPPDQSFGNILLDIDPFKSKKMEEIRIRINKKMYAFEECQYCFGNFDE